MPGHRSRKLKLPGWSKPWKSWRHTTVLPSTVTRRRALLKHLFIAKGAEVFNLREMPMLLLSSVMGVKVHNQREVLPLLMLRVMGVEVYNLREVLTMPLFLVMVAKVFNQMEAPPLPLSM